MFSNATSYQPSEWKDDERMSVLFKQLPPTEQAAARQARINFWTTALHNWCTVTNTLTFTLQDAKQAFERNSQQPQCLLAVLQHLVAQGNMCYLSELILSTSIPGTSIESSSSESWGGWGVRLLVQTPRWAWSKLRSPVGSAAVSLCEHEVLLDLRLLQERSNELYNAFWKQSQSSTSEHFKHAAETNSALLREPSRVRTLSELYREVSTRSSSVQELELGCRFLVKQRLARMQEKNGVLYIKLAKPGETLQDCHAGIAPTEMVELELEAACRQLQQRVDELNTESAELHVKAKQALLQSRRTQALSLLRRQKRAEASLKVQLSALDNATSCSHQLSDTRVNREVIAAFRNSALALKELVSGDDSADAVAETMDQLQEVLEECSDVNDLLSSGTRVSAGGDYDDSVELEDELNAMLAQENADDVVAALDALRIPSNSPGAGTTRMVSSSVADRRLDESLASTS